jgi:RNA polymerase subunit RPABC4/transcription elongation factor Spt4
MVSVLIGFPGGSLEATLRLAGMLILAYVLILWLGAIVWVYRDIRNRTNDQTSQLIAVLLVALFNLPGLMVYLVIRPQSTMADAYERSLEAEALLHELQLSATACQGCHRPIEDDFNICPHCRTVLREPCRNCGKAIRTSWNACPYCATDRVVPRARPAATARRRPEGEEPGIAGYEPLQPPARTMPGPEEAEEPATPRRSPTRAAPRQG